MTEIIPALAGFTRILLNLAFLLFIPGFVVSLVFYPHLSDITVFERLVFSGVASIATTMVALLFLDVALGIETGPGNTLLILLLITAAVLCLWRIEWYLLKKFINPLPPVPLQIRVYRGIWQIIHTVSGYLKTHGNNIISRIRKLPLLKKKDKDHYE